MTTNHEMSSLIFPLSVAFLFSLSFSPVGLNFSFPIVSLSFSVSARLTLIFLPCLSHFLSPSLFSFSVCLTLVSFLSVSSCFPFLFSFLSFSFLLFQQSHSHFPLSLSFSLSIFLSFPCHFPSLFISSLSSPHCFSLSAHLALVLSIFHSSLFPSLSISLYLLVFLPLCSSHSRSLLLSFLSLSLQLCCPHWAHH